MAAALRDALDRKRLSTLGARAALLGGLLAITDDDRGRALYVVTLGAATFRAHTLEQLESLLDQIEQGKDLHA